jgi:putative transport protein
VAGSLTDTLASNPVLLLFVVAALGFAVGRIRVGGFSLGVAAVLFAGIALGALDDRLKLPDPFWVLGLALFVYTVGLASGPGFIGAMRRRGWATNRIVLSAIVASALVALAGHAWLGLSGPRATGAFAGGETNTPALAAALETLKGKEGFDQLAADPIVGYSLSYPLGVVLPLLVVWAVLRRERRRPGVPAPALFVRTVLVERGAGTLDQLRERHGGSVSFGRLKRAGALVAAVGTLEPAPGDLLSVVGTADEVALIERELGRRAPEEIELDRHELDFRRIVVSSRAVAGRRIVDLHLEDRFGAAATRLRRGDVDLVAEPDLHLELGDAIRIVAPRARMREIAAFFGDSFRALGEVDVLTFSAGIAAGLALGAVAFPLPGGGSFSLGFAGGPLVAGLVLGALARTGPFVWQLPYTANLTLRQFGMVLFLAGVGTRSGPAFADAIVDPSALLAIAVGAAVTATALLILLGAGTRLLHLPTPTLIGVLAGMQTQPAVLAYASDQLDNERELTLGYASVYPVAMITKIVIAQVLAALTL